jgi:trk system potassium uptake protein TrkH
VPAWGLLFWESPCNAPSSVLYFCCKERSRRYAFFQVASFGSTTGFVSHNYDDWPAFSKLLLGLMYFTGACAGSTAGGIKICRFVVLVKTVAAELRRAMHPQMLLSVYYNNKILPVSTIMNIAMQ